MHVPVTPLSRDPQRVAIWKRGYPVISLRKQFLVLFSALDVASPVRVELGLRRDGNQVLGKKRKEKKKVLFNCLSHLIVSSPFF